MGDMRRAARCAQHSMLVWRRHAEELGRDGAEGAATLRVPARRVGGAQIRCRVGSEVVGVVRQASWERAPRARIALSVGATATGAHLCTQFNE